MAEAERGQNRDLILAPNEYAFILDETKGQINSCVGPYKTSLANTDRPVIFDPASRKYTPVTLDKALITFPFAAEGDYIVLENPSLSADANAQHPTVGTSNTAAKLKDGQRVNIAGPKTFPLWPGQVATVVPGHHLRLNQYLVVRVYNEEAATANWSTAVVKPQKQAEASTDPAAESETIPATPPDLTTGQLFLIKGTEVSFYIPPTGIEVLAETPASGNTPAKYVREAVSLERLEYCILLGENGDKRYVIGPAVVFPTPTETFISQGTERKNRAIQLPENSGIYIQVIADYTEDDGTERKVGEELFITGASHPIYFPRQEHSIVKYGDEMLHFAVAIPPGEGRYVLDKKSGAITTVKGPKMFLPDPRKEVIVRRALTRQMVEMLYPNNAEALAYNMSLAQQSESSIDESMAFGDLGGVGGRLESLGGGSTRALYAMTTNVAAHETPQFAGDSTKRRQKFSKPRSIVLDSKYEGAVAIAVWTGYAVLVVKKTGEQRVVVGPTTTLLDYDESVMVLELSTGKPKTTDKLYNTVYLRVTNNKVSDVIDADTSDMVNVKIKVSYRVNFESTDGEGNEVSPEKWFAVENYVKFLCDHCRSRVRNCIQRVGIQEFNENVVDTIRDVILGKHKDGEPRDGLFFDENAMRIYDVEVLGVEIGDAQINRMLQDAQHNAVSRAINTREAQAELEATKATEDIARQSAAEKAETARKVLEQQKLTDEVQQTLQIARIMAACKLQEEEFKQKMNAQDLLKAVADAELERTKVSQEAALAYEKMSADQKLAYKEAELKLTLNAQIAESEAVTARMKAIQPDLIAALQNFADKDAVARVAEAMAPMSLLGGTSVADIIGKALKGTMFEEVAGNLAGKALASKH